MTTQFNVSNLGKMPAQWLASALVPFIMPEPKSRLLVKTISEDEISAQSHDYFEFAHRRAEQLYGILAFSKVNKSCYEACKGERERLMLEVARAIENIRTGRRGHDIFTSLNISCNLVALNVYYCIFPKRLRDHLADGRNVVHCAVAPNEGGNIAYFFVRCALELDKEHQLNLCAKRDSHQLTPLEAHRQKFRLGGIAGRIWHQGKKISKKSIKNLLVEHIANNYPMRAEKEEKKS